MSKLNFLFSIKKANFVVVLLTAALLVIPSYALASTVFETTGWIIESEGLEFEFLADQSPYTYQVTLSDLSEPPFFGFEFLFLSISTSTDTLGSIIGPGVFDFEAVPGETYFANIFGTGGGDVGAGLFGIEVAAVPIPGAIWLLGSGLIGIVGLRRTFRQ